MSIHMELPKLLKSWILTCLFKLWWIVLIQIHDFSKKGTYTYIWLTCYHYLQAWYEHYFFGSSMCIEIAYDMLSSAHRTVSFWIQKTLSCKWGLGEHNILKPVCGLVFCVTLSQTYFSFWTSLHCGVIYVSCIVPQEQLHCNNKRPIIRIIYLSLI